MCVRTASGVLCGNVTVLGRGQAAVCASHLVSGGNRSSCGVSAAHREHNGLPDPAGQHRGQHHHHPTQQTREEERHHCGGQRVVNIGKVM